MTGKKTAQVTKARFADGGKDIICVHCLRRQSREKFCEGCGRLFVGPTLPYKAMQASQAKGSSVMWAALVVAILVAIAVVTIFDLWHGVLIGIGIWCAIWAIQKIISDAVAEGIRKGRGS